MESIVLIDPSRWLFWWLFVLYFAAVSCTTMQQSHFVTVSDYSALQSAAFSCTTYKTDFKSEELRVRLLPAHTTNHHS